MRHYIVDTSRPVATDVATDLDKNGHGRRHPRSLFFTKTRKTERTERQAKLEFFKRRKKATMVKPKKQNER